MNWIVLGIVCLVVLILGGGAGFWIWIITRPKKITWPCQIYQLGEGVKPPLRMKGKNGKWHIIRDYQESELVSYTKDVIEKVDKKNGATFYWLQKMKKAVPVVTADCVEKWGNEKLVKVLLDGDTCTLLKGVYDRKLAKIIFNPLPHDRINMIKTEISEREARINDIRDILTSITPFITLGITMLALVSIVYFEVQGAVKIAELNNQGMEQISKSLYKLDSDLIASGLIEAKSDGQEVKKEQPPVIPP